MTTEKSSPVPSPHEPARVAADTSIAELTDAQTEAFIVGSEIDLFWMSEKLEIEVTAMETSALEADLDELRFYVKDEVGRCLGALLLRFAQLFLRQPPT